MNAVEAVAAYGGVRPASRALGVPYSTMHKRFKAAAKDDPRAKRKPGPEAKATTAKPEFEFPALPPSKLSAPKLIKRLAEDARMKKERRDAEKWMRVHVRDNKPLGILWFGDPHLGSDTNWDRLESDVALCAATKGLFGANLGDTTNNWVGRLTRLYADCDTSRQSERTLAKWFLAEAGITWLIWLMGNHDEWEHGAEILKLMDIHNKVPMLDWSAKFELCFPNKSKVRINAAHDFPGHSMWSTTHAPARAPRMLGTDADLYICGHRHDWGIQQFEMAERGLCPMAIRARGYKVGDSYARRNGYQEANYGASILTIIDPTADASGRVLAFADVKQGARVLTALRGGK
jgi:hypothetical protein